MKILIKKFALCVLMVAFAATPMAFATGGGGGNAGDGAGTGGEGGGVVVSCGRTYGNCWFCLITFDYGPECVWDGSPRSSCTPNLRGACN